MQQKVTEEIRRLVSELEDGAKTAFGTDTQYFGAIPSDEERQGISQEVQQAVEELKMENSSDNVEEVLNNITGGLQTLHDAITTGHLPAALVLKGIQTYVQGPLNRLLGADALSKKIADDVRALTVRRNELGASHDTALAAAASRADRQSIKSHHFQLKEQFYSEALAKLESHIDSDRAVLSSLEMHGTPEVEQAYASVQTLVKDSILTRQHVRAKGLSYEADPAQLQQEALSLQHRLDANSLKLHASLAETLRLLQEHTELQTELTNVQVMQKIRAQVEQAVEARRTELVAAIDEETKRLAASQDSVKLFLGISQGFADKIRGICQVQQHESQARLLSNAHLFADIYQEFYKQLQELHTGKVKCMKALQVEFKRLLKEQSRWEELEHELPGAQQLIKLDDRLEQIKEFQAQLSLDVDVLAGKVEALKDCGPDILSQVPGFLHPSEEFALDRTERLDKKRQQLTAMLHKYGPMQFTEEDLNYESSSADTCAEPSRPIERHVAESPYKIQRHLQRITQEIVSSPFASRFLKSSAKELPEEVGPQVPVPTAEMLQFARETKRAPETRGTALGTPKAKRRRHRSQSSGQPLPQ
eukprot:GGOE01003120.1.p1 GENE.GGOE01003120.1~~GGOE01003120.1.p1  ORF type:complete len:638 (-),score=199.24 GGOE01003120.1:403-2172(-)